LWEKNKNKQKKKKKMNYLKNYLIDINFIFENDKNKNNNNDNNQKLINLFKKNFLKKINTLFSKQIIGCGGSYSFILDEKGFY
jgi:hypothetical protein